MTTQPKKSIIDTLVTVFKEDLRQVEPGEFFESQLAEFTDPTDEEHNDTRLQRRWNFWLAGLKTTVQGMSIGVCPHCSGLFDINEADYQVNDAVDMTFCSFSCSSSFLVDPKNAPLLIEKLNEYDLDSIRTIIQTELQPADADKVQTIIDQMYTKGN